MDLQGRFNSHYGFAKSGITHIVERYPEKSNADLSALFCMRFRNHIKGKNDRAYAECMIGEMRADKSSLLLDSFCDSYAASRFMGEEEKELLSMSPDVLGGYNREFREFAKEKIAECKANAEKCLAAIKKIAKNGSAALKSFENAYRQASNMYSQQGQSWQKADIKHTPHLEKSEGASLEPPTLLTDPKEIEKQSEENTRSVYR